MPAAMPDIVIRRIRPSDGPLLRDLRLRSLVEAPEAFGQRPEEAAAQADAEWTAAARAASQGERRAWFIAERSGGRDNGSGAGGAGPRTVGVVLGRRRPPRTLMIFSMWTDPAVRRAGIGSRLIEAVEAWAAGWGADRSVLWVFAANEPAIRFYLRIGFAVQDDGEDARTGAQYGALAMERAIRVTAAG